MAYHHKEPYTVPDYTIYKIDNYPKLVEVQRTLEAQGLHDPWLRNEVWRFNPDGYGTHKSRFRAFFYRGFRTGLIATGITIILTPIYNAIVETMHERKRKRALKELEKKQKMEIVEVIEAPPEKKEC